MVDRPRIFSEDQLLDYVRQQASPELLNQIETEMARDPVLRAEIALMRGLKPSLQAPGPLNPPGEFGWRRLETEIRRDAKANAPGKETRRSPLWRAAAVVFGIAALGQATYIGTTLNSSDDDTYRTASRATEDHVLGIAFASDAQAADISALLRNADGRLIGGPSALNLYRVAFNSANALSEGRTMLGASPLIDLVAEE